MTRLRLVPEPRDRRGRRGWLFFARPLAEATDLSVEVRDPSDASSSMTCTEAQLGVTSMPFEFQVGDVACPGRRTSRTSTACASSCPRRRGVVDAIEDRFGFRTIETRDGQFYLNGEPLYLRGALDQDYYPDTICTVPSVEFLEDQFRKAKELGLNCLRCHIKAADPRYYEVADRIGMLIWTELPNGGMATERSRGRKEKLLKGIVDRDGNHPSIIIWTIINENWGVDLVHDADHREWLKRTFAWLKAYDPTRLVVDNSPLAPSFHVESDIADYHFYAAIPDHRDDWDKFVDGLAGRASWLYSPYGDAVITGHEPLMCSEFGNWGLPYPKDLRDQTGEEPWWFETGHDWGEGVMYAHGVENRFSDWSLDRVFGDLRRFVTAAQWQQFRALKYQIEAMRRKPHARRLRHHRAARLPLGIERPARHAPQSARLPRAVPHRQLRHGDRAEVGAAVLLVRRNGPVRGRRSRMAPGPALEDCQLSIRLGDDERQLDLPRIEAPTVLDLGRIELRVPDLAEAGTAPDLFRAARIRWTAGRAEPSRPGGSSAPRRAAPWRRARLVPSRRDLATASRALGYDAARAIERMRRSSSRATTTRRSPTMCAPGREPAAAARGRDQPLSVLPALAERAGSAPGTAPSGWAIGRRLSRGCGEPIISPAFPAVRSSTRRWTASCPDLRHRGLQPARFPGPRVRRTGRRLDPQAGGARGRALLRAGTHGRVDLPAVPGRAARRPDRDHAVRRSRRARGRKPRARLEEAVRAAEAAA